MAKKKLNIKPKVKLSDWEIVLPKAQFGKVTPRDVVYTDKVEYENAKKREGDSMAYHNYYKLQQQNEPVTPKGFMDYFSDVSNGMIWNPINKLSNSIEEAINPGKLKKEAEDWEKMRQDKWFPMMREMDIAAMTGDSTAGKQAVHKYGYDNQPQRKEFWENQARTGNYPKQRQENLKAVWGDVDQSKYKDFADFQAKHQKLWDYGDSLIKANPRFSWSNELNSPDLAHTDIVPTGQWKGLAFNNSLMQPPSTHPIYKPVTHVGDESNIPKEKTKRLVIQQPTPKQVAPPDTITVPQYSKIVDGKRITLTEKEYKEMTKGKSSTPTGMSVKQEGKVVQVKQLGGSILPKAQNGTINLQDKRSVDQFGNQLKDNQRRSVKGVNVGMLEELIKGSVKRNINPATTAAIALQETNFGQGDYHKTNPLHYNHYSKFSDEPGVLNNSLDFLQDRYKEANRLGKIGDADSIQSWNGYGKIKPGVDTHALGKWAYKNEDEFDDILHRGKIDSLENAWRKPVDKLYGKSFTKEKPLNFNEDPIYGKTVANLRDSVILQNPQIVDLINKYQPQVQKQKPYVQPKQFPGQSIQTPEYKHGGLLKAKNGLNTSIKGTKKQYGDETQKQIDFIKSKGFDVPTLYKGNKKNYPQIIFDIYKTVDLNTNKVDNLQSQNLNSLNSLNYDFTQLQPNLSKLDNPNTLPQHINKPINIIDNRSVDQFGRPLQDKYRRGQKNVNPLMVNDLIQQSYKNNIDPNTTLAIALQETSLGRVEKHTGRRMPM